MSSEMKPSGKKVLPSDNPDLQWAIPLGLFGGMFLNQNLRPLLAPTIGYIPSLLVMGGICGLIGWIGALIAKSYRERHAANPPEATGVDQDRREYP